MPATNSDYSRSRSAAVARRRRKVKTILVHEAGGACCICGYDRNMRALHFHHVDPSRKRHEINAKGVAIALEVTPFLALLAAGGALLGGAAS